MRQDVAPARPLLEGGKEHARRHGGGRAVYFRPAPPSDTLHRKRRAAVQGRVSPVRRHGGETTQDLMKFSEAVCGPGVANPAALPTIAAPPAPAKPPRTAVGKTLKDLVLAARVAGRMTGAKGNEATTDTTTTTTTTAAAPNATTSDVKWRPGSVRRALDKPCGTHRAFDVQGANINVSRFFIEREGAGGGADHHATPASAYSALFQFFRLTSRPAPPSAALRRIPPLLLKAAYLSLCDAAGGVSLQQLRCVFDLLSIRTEAPPGRTRPPAAAFLDPIRDTASSNRVTYCSFKQVLSGVLGWDPADAFAYLFSKVRGRGHTVLLQSVSIVTKGEMAAFLQACSTAMDIAHANRCCRGGREDDERMEWLASLYSRLRVMVEGMQYDRVGAAPLLSFLDALSRDAELLHVLRPPSDLMSLVDADVHLPQRCRDFLTSRISSLTGLCVPFHPDLTPPTSVRWPPQWASRPGDSAQGFVVDVSLSLPSVLSSDTKAAAGVASPNKKVAPSTWLQRALKKHRDEGGQLGVYHEVARFVSTELSSSEGE